MNIKQSARSSYTYCFDKMDYEAKGSALSHGRLRHLFCPTSRGGGACDVISVAKVR